MPAIQVADLPGINEPGAYTVEKQGTSGGASPTNRLLFFGYMAAGGTATANTPFRCLSQTDVDNAVRSYSMAAHAYAAAKAQAGLGGELWCMPLDAPSSGTAQAFSIEFVGEPLTRGLLSTASAALAADTVTVRIAGRGENIGIAKSDTWAAIATAVKAKLDLIDNFPWTIGISGAILTFTARHKGLFDAGAVEVSFATKGVSGCAAKLGTIVITGTAGADGTFTITMGAKSAAVAVTNADVLTVTGTGLVTKLNSDAYPVRACEPASPTGTVTLLFQNGRPIRPLSITSTTSAVTTQTCVPSVGTAGAGVPTLTSALANLAASDDSYRAIAPFWNSTTELSTLAVHIEAQAIAPLSKGQVVIIPALVGSLTALSTLNYPEATTPHLSATARYTALWAQGAVNAAWELSVRVAAAVAVATFVGTNFNKLVLKGSDTAPLVALHPLDRPNVDDRNACIALRHSPIAVNADGKMNLTWGGNCYKVKGVSDSKFNKIGDRITRDYVITYFNSRMAYLTQLKIKTSGQQGRTTNSTDLESIKTLAFQITVELENLDLFDGAEKARDAILAAVVGDTKRVDVNAVCRTLADIDIVAITLAAE